MMSNETSPDRSWPAASGSPFGPGGELEPLGSLVDALDQLGDRAELHEQFGPEGARLYDDCYGLDPHEIAALRQVFARAPGPVLELAAGNGRLTVPLLQMGREVTALDLSEGMLDVLRDRASHLRGPLRERLHIHQGDMTDISLPPDLPQRYGVVALLLASISILDAPHRVATLVSARKHLAPGGAILISVVVFRTPLEEGFDVAHETTGRSGQPYWIHEIRRPGSSVRQVSIVPRLDDPRATVPVAIGVHHVLVLDEILAEVAEAGLEVRDQSVVESPDQGLAEVFLELVERAAEG
jgi:SAM-dependent methyltransferase